ncbi:MAG TPA: MBL fold metallo-hydrolase [Candidatus Sulfotelmatobacter sp.]|nr:MBL fold metallo-hydrolase [Candidatus Sulfotelmatobacter sp.]
MTDETAPELSPLAGVIVPVTPFAQNCSIIWCTATRRAAVVDPGGEIDRIVEAADEAGVTIEKILLTHGHLDHAGGTADLRERLGVPVEGPQREDAFWIERIEAEGARYGMAWCRRFAPDRWLSDGDAVTVGAQALAVLYCPGHTPGHIVFFHAGARLALVGDVLFQGSIGRTDLPRGDHATLIRSITTKLWPLGDDVTFVPGHGPLSTFGEERAANPYVGDAALRGAGF